MRKAPRFTYELDQARSASSRASTTCPETCAGICNLPCATKACRQDVGSTLPIEPVKHVPLIALWLAWQVGVVALGEPYVPKSDDEVLERLPSGVRGSDFRRQRDELAQDPENLRDSVALAWSYLETARAEGDTRFVGYAQAILAPWWDSVSPPVEALVARAAVLVGVADYGRALADLEVALRTDPGHLEGLRLEYAIHIAQGRLDRAQATLDRLAPKLGGLEAVTCRCELSGLTGAGAPAFDQLRTAIGEATGAPAPARQRAWSVLAGIADRLGRGIDADQCFKRALETGRRDVQLLADYSDFLLAENRAADAAGLVRDGSAIDGLLLRRIEAEGTVESTNPDAPAQRQALAEELKGRFERRRRLGDPTLPYDEARFCLRVLREPGRALALASDNWSLRRTVADARLLVEAAQTAGNREAAQPAVDWARGHQLEDARIDALLAPRKRAP